MAIIQGNAAVRPTSHSDKRESKLRSLWQINLQGHVYIAVTSAKFSSIARMSSSAGVTRCERRPEMKLRKIVVVPKRRNEASNIVQNQPVWSDATTDIICHQATLRIVIEVAIPTSRLGCGYPDTMNKHGH